MIRTENFILLMLGRTLRCYSLFLATINTGKIATPME